jgi:hypothetical protein
LTASGTSELKAPSVNLLTAQSLGGGRLDFIAGIIATYCTLHASVEAGRRRAVRLADRRARRGTSIPQASEMRSPMSSRLTTTPLSFTPS